MSYNAGITIINVNRFLTNHIVFKNNKLSYTMSWANHYIKKLKMVKRYSLDQEVIQ